jgi:hypothetical protein
MTPARIVVEDIADDSIVRLWPRSVKETIPGVDYEELMLEPGAALCPRHRCSHATPWTRRYRVRNTVFFPLKFAFFLCEKHDQLTGNINFQDNLLHALLNVDRDTGNEKHALE